MAQRRSRGEGSIHALADGTFRGYLTLPDEIVDGVKRRRRRYVYGRTRPEVRLELDQLRVTLAEGGTVRSRSDRTTLGAYLTTWVAGVEVGDKTRAQYDWIVRDYLVPRLGSVRLDQLETADVTAFLVKLRREDVGDRTRQLCHDVLRIAIRRAVRGKIIRANPLDGVDRPHAHRREVDPWTAEEARSVLDAARTDRFHALYEIEIRLGLQFPGEVLALRWDRDVDLKARKLRIGAQLATKTRKRAPTKTDARRRELDLPDAIVNALHAHRERLLSEGLRSSPYVFPNGLGGPQSARNFVRDSFEKVVERAGRARCRSCARPFEDHDEAGTIAGVCNGFEPGVRRVRPYDMRHTFATLALIGGVHIKTVSRMLGHANVVETLRTYSHFVPAMVEDANLRIGAQLDEPTDVAR